MKTFRQLLTMIREDREAGRGSCEPTVRSATAPRFKRCREAADTFRAFGGSLG